MAARAAAHPSITIHLNTGVEDAHGDAAGAALGGLDLLDTATGERRRLAVRGCFYGIGHSPNSSLLAGSGVELDAAGYVKVTGGVRTSVEGVFAAGDLADHEWRQAVTAAGTGCQAALAAERWLAEKGLVEAAPAAAAGAAAGGKPRGAPPGGAPPAEPAFDPAARRHRGQFALRKLYHESDAPIAVLFGSPSCGPCRALKPILAKTAAEFGDVHLVEIDVEAEPDTARAAGVTGTPTVQVFRRKDLLVSLQGVRARREYRAALEAALEAEAAAV
jgi:thioredoxin reductase (NADPH)